MIICLFKRHRGRAESNEMQLPPKHSPSLYSGQERIVKSFIILDMQEWLRSENSFDLLSSFAPLQSRDDHAGRPLSGLPNNPNFLIQLDP